MYSSIVHSTYTYGTRVQRNKTDKKFIRGVLCLAVYSYEHTRRWKFSRNRRLYSRFFCLIFSPFHLFTIFFFHHWNGLADEHVVKIGAHRVGIRRFVLLQRFGKFLIGYSIRIENERIKAREITFVFYFCILQPRISTSYTRSSARWFDKWEKSRSHKCEVRNTNPFFFLSVSLCFLNFKIPFRKSLPIFTHARINFTIN